MQKKTFTNIYLPIALAMFYIAILYDLRSGVSIIPISLSTLSFDLFFPKHQQPTRLRITNNCYFPIWIQHSNNINDPQNIRLNYSRYHDYNIPDNGVASTMFWPKIGCDSNGNNCEIGQSIPPCPSEGCQPPISSKFEATWADINCPQVNPGSACMTHYDTSQVDGYTLPFNIDVYGQNVDVGSCVKTNCAKLSLEKCPSNENLSGKGMYPSFNKVDLKVYSKRDPDMVIGCMSPCKKLNYPEPWGYGLTEGYDPTLHMCCPTNHDRIKNGTCTLENGCISPDECRDKSNKLSVVRTRYVQNMHKMCPDVFSYAYDDVRGHHACASRTKIHVTFCPLVY